MALTAVRVSGRGRPRAGQGRAETDVALGLSVQFAGVKAVDEVDIDIRRGEVLGLIGPNGAGKTTLVNALTGLEAPTAGRVNLGERDVTGVSAHRLARAGVTRTFQSGRLF